MSQELIDRARNNLLRVRAELQVAKGDIDDPRAALEQVSLAVEIVKADAAIAQAELLADISQQLRALTSHPKDKDATRDAVRPKADGRGAGE